MSCPHCDPSRPALCDYNIEMALISCLMQSPETQVDAALRSVSTADFQNEVTGLLFDLIVRRHSDGQPVDPVSLTSYVFDKGMQAAITPSIITDAYTASANPSNTTHYAEVVREFSKRRQMVSIASELARAALDGGNDEWKARSIDVMRKADVALMGKDGDEIVKLGEVADQYARAFEHDFTHGIDPFVPTEIDGLDKLLDGGIRREYILIGGLQGHGKSLLAMQMAGRLANAGRRGFIIGYDMTPIQVFMRDLARETGVPLSKIMGRSPTEQNGDFWDITRGITRIRNGWDCFYTSSPYITFETAAAHARSLHRQKPLDFIVLDFLQKVPITKKSKERTDEALVGLSRRVWALQRELGCTLIAPVQLNDDGLIREARGLLDDPEVFIRIEMEETAGETGESETGDNGFLRILKNRFGAKDRSVPVSRNGPLQKFQDRPWEKPATKANSKPQKPWSR